MSLKVALASHLAGHLGIDKRTAWNGEGGGYQFTANVVCLGTAMISEFGPM